MIASWKGKIIQKDGVTSLIIVDEKGMLQGIEVILTKDRNQDLHVRELPQHRQEGFKEVENISLPKDYLELMISLAHSNTYLNHLPYSINLKEKIRN